MSEVRLTDNAAAFIKANRKSPVVFGQAVDGGGRGANYRLKNGRTFDLTREECEQIGQPRWAIGNGDAH